MQPPGCEFAVRTRDCTEIQMQSLFPAIQKRHMLQFQHFRWMGGFLKRQVVRLLQLKMPLRVELVQRRVREQANRQCKLRVVREHVQIQPALSGRPVRLWRMIV